MHARPWTTLVSNDAGPARPGRLALLHIHTPLTAGSGSVAFFLSTVGSSFQAPGRQDQGNCFPLESLLAPTIFYSTSKTTSVCVSIPF